jgi:mRNA interferase MazF
LVDAVRLRRREQMRRESLQASAALNNERTQVLIEQTTALAPERLGTLMGHVNRDELDQISEALRLALALD